MFIIDIMRIFNHFISFSSPPELLSGLNDSSFHLKPSSSPFSSPSPSCNRTGSQPTPSSPPSALPTPGISSSSSSSTSKASPPPPALTSSSLSPAPPPHSKAFSKDNSLSAELEEEKAKKLLYCSLCKVAVNSLSQLEAHSGGEFSSMQSND